jgi:hypothetical protein
MVPLAVAVGAVVAGALLGGLAGVRHVLLASWASAIIALGAVVLGLLPEAIAEVGWAALAVAALAAALPWVAEVIGRRAQPPGQLGLELAYAALLVHQLGDGVAIGALGSDHVGHHHEGSLLALGLHSAALAAVFVLLWRTRSGLRAAVLRAAGMAVAVVVGAVIVPVLPSAWVVVAHPWVAAGAGGLLLHVAVHPLLHRPGPSAAVGNA